MSICVCMLFVSAAIFFNFEPQALAGLRMAIAVTQTLPLLMLSTKNGLKNIASNQWRTRRQVGLILLLKYMLLDVELARAVSSNANSKSRPKAEVEEARATKIRPARDLDACRQLASGFTRLLVLHQTNAATTGCVIIGDVYRAYSQPSSRHLRHRCRHSRRHTARHPN